MWWLFRGGMGGVIVSQYTCTIVRLVDRETVHQAIYIYSALHLPARGVSWVAQSPTGNMRHPLED
jgi:hypothetical protein